MASNDPLVGTGRLIEAAANDRSADKFTPFRDMWQSLAGDLGITTKRMRRGLVERELERQQFWTSEQESFNAEIDGLMESAANPEDIMQLRQLREIGNRGFRASQSTNPDIQKSAAPMLEAVAKERLAFARRQEEDAIARAASMDAADRDMEALNYTRDLAFSDEIRQNVVEPYFQQREIANKALSLLETGDRLGYEAAFTAFVQGIDNSVVREGERLIYGGSNGLVVQAVDMFNKFAGENATPESIAAVRNGTNALLNGRADALRRELATYREQVDAYGGDPDRVFSVVPDELFETREIDRSLQTQPDEVSAAEAPELEQVQPGLIPRGVAAATRGAFNTFNDVRRLLTGTQLMRAEDGTLFEVAPDGTQTKVGRETVFERDDGNLYQLVDRGDGRFEWRLVKQRRRFEIVEPSGSTRVRGVIQR